jgi:hypothetical protein
MGIDVGDPEAISQFCDNLTFPLSSPCKAECPKGALKISEENITFYLTVLCYSNTD